MNFLLFLRKCKQFTVVGDQHINHPSRCADDDFSSPLQFGYLLGNASSTVNADHSQVQRSRKFLAFLTNLQAQLACRWHDDSYNKIRWVTRTLFSELLTYRWGRPFLPEAADPKCDETWAVERLKFYHFQFWQCQWCLSLSTENSTVISFVIKTIKGKLEPTWHDGRNCLSLDGRRFLIAQFF